MNFKENSVIFHCKTYYPVGLFLSQQKSKFFNFIKKQSNKHYNPDNYQTIGATMLEKLFDKYDIKNLFNLKICNKDYYLPFEWNELDKIFESKFINNILPLNNIGIHWFNGADKSKVYANELNKRISNFKSNCFLDKYIIKLTKFNLKISIIIAYFNRKNQIIQVLNKFNELYSNKYEFEVIIVDDKSNEENMLDNILDNYNFNIKYIKILKKKWCNPVIPYNVAIKNISLDTDYVFIQNPEIYHSKDLFEYIKFCEKNIYYTFPVFNSPDYKYNKKIENVKNIYEDFVQEIDYKDFQFDYNFYKSKYPEEALSLNRAEALKDFLENNLSEEKKCNKEGIFYSDTMVDTRGWLNHKKYNNRNLHFLSLIEKKYLDQIGGFNSNMKDGFWYDDNELVVRINKLMNIKTIDNYDYTGIHLYHENGSETHETKEKICLRQKNLKILNDSKKTDIIYCNPNIKVNTLSKHFYKNKIGLCFKLFTNENTNKKRYDIIDIFIKHVNMLLNYYENLTCVGVVDCIPNYELRNKINKIDKRIKIIILNENKGISFATNIGIEYLIKNSCYYIFCLDDDIKIKNYNVLNFYIDNLEYNNIKLLGYYALKEKEKLNIPSPCVTNSHKNLNKINYGFSGCFYCFRSDDIYSIGYLPIFDKKYGEEHVIFTKKYTEFHFDVKGSNKYLELNNQSFSITSGYSEENKNMCYTNSIKKYKCDDYFISQLDKYYFVNPIGIEKKFQIFICVINKEQAEYTKQNLKKFEHYITIIIENNIPSFSYLVNKCLKKCSSKYMIFCSHRVNPKEDDLNRLLCKLDKGYGYVGLWRLAFFGINKEILKKVGYFDEKFYKGGYEDDDFRIRLNYNNIGFYEDHSISYNAGTSTCTSATASAKNKDYLLKKYDIDIEKKTITINIMEKTDENYPTSNILTYDDSIYVKEINSFYGKLGPGIHDFKIIKSDMCQYYD